MAEATDRPTPSSAPPPAEARPFPGSLPPPTPEAQDYRPLSGLALTSALVAGLYATAVVGGGIVALYYWWPFLMPLWTLLLPMVGLLLAMAAQRQIRHSQGTRAGAGLARASLWTCVLLGLIYVSFYTTTRFVVCRQADQHVQRWFDKLKEANKDGPDENLERLLDAYLLTRDPRVRRGLSASNQANLRARFDVAQPGGKGDLTMFLMNDLVHFVQRGGADTEVLPQGVQNWEFSEGGYSVRRLYRVRTPEGEMAAVLEVRSAESRTTPREFEGRQWHVRWDSSTIQILQKTELGNQNDTTRKHAFLFVSTWAKKLSGGRLEEAYLDLWPADEHERRREEFKAGKVELEHFLNRKGLKVEEAKMEAPFLAGVRGLFRPAGDDRPLFTGLSVNPVSERPWTVEKGRYQFFFDCDLTLREGQLPKYRSEVTLVVEGQPGQWRLLRMDLGRTVDPLRTAGGPPGG